jgi:hypothetical protein
MGTSKNVGEQSILFICHLFDDAVKISDYTMLNDSMINDWKVSETSGSDPISGTVLAPV